ncbi:MAG: TPM domain-containing protein [Betaproteobacteria bacterium]|nr:TPM domain-containing protein [Betaproteobacteria bacterium]
MTRTAGRLLWGAAVSFFVAFAALAADVSEPIAVPKLTDRVVDLTGTLAAPERDALAAKLKAFEATKGSQVAVLMVPSIGTETIEEFATRVTDDWKLGRKGVDDGVLFVIAKQERRMRIQTGRGVQGVLTDALSRRIIAELVSPRFRTGDFAGGIDAGVNAILKAIEGESLPVPAKQASRGTAPSSSSSSASIENLFWLAIVVVPVVGMILRALVGRFLGAALTSGITGLATWFIFGSLFVGGIVGVIAFIAVLMGIRFGGPGGWSTGGSSGGGGWSSGGGGFSGGGGGFDGGGASGNW